MLRVGKVILQRPSYHSLSRPSISKLCASSANFFSSSTEDHRRKQYDRSSSLPLALGVGAAAVVTTAIGLAIVNRDRTAQCKVEAAPSTRELGSVVKGLPTITASEVNAHKTAASRIWVRFP